MSRCMDITFKRLCVNEAEAANDREVKASLSPRLYQLGNRSPHCEASGNFVVTERLLADNKTNAAKNPPMHYKSP